MSVRMRSSSVQMNVAGTSSNSITVTKPFQTAEGDFMIAVTTGPQNTLTPPSGWLRIGSFDGTLLRNYIYTKTATASEPANYVWGFSTSDCHGVSIATFFGGRDIHIWNIKGTGTTNPISGRNLDAARDSVGYAVFSWQDNATATMSWDQGIEQFDNVSNDTAGTRFRGITATMFGPSQQLDIVNIGDRLPGPTVTQSQAVGAGLMLSMLIDGEAPDAEPWSDTDGHFDVELMLDRKAVNSNGSITSRFAGDVTGDLAAATANADGVDLNRAYDGTSSTYFFSNTAVCWLQYDFGVGVTKEIRRYRLTSSGSDQDRDPTDWTLQGSNDGVSFDVLDTRVGQAFGLRRETREFRVVAPGEYRYYRLDVTKNASLNVVNVTRIAEFRLSDIDTWETVTDSVTYGEKVRITRGLQSSSGRSDFTRAYVTLDNTDGRFSMRNYRSKYFGALQRNTPMRISKAYGTKGLQLQGDVELAGADMCGDGIRTPIRTTLADSSGFEFRIDFEPESWRDAQHIAGVSVAEIGTETPPWTLTLLDDGRLQFIRMVTGSVVHTYTSTEAVPMGGRRTILCGLDVDNGAGGSNVVFRLSDSISGSFTQLGATVVAPTTASTLFTGGALCVGHIGSFPGRGLHGTVYAWQMRNGIGATVISEIDFTALPNGAHTWSENDNVWITINNAVVSNRRYRFHGEVAEWPMAWDTTGTWIEVAATGAGVQKRLERGNDPASVMRRYHTKGIIADPGAFERFAAPFAYWPIEDEKNVITLASGLPKGAPMQILSSPDFEGADGDKFPESAPLPKINGSEYRGKISGNPSGYANIRWMLHAPTAIASSVDFADIYATGDIARMQVTHESANQWRIRGFREDDDGTVVWDTGNLAVSTTGELMHMELILDQIGADVWLVLTAYDTYGTDLGTHTRNFAPASTLNRVHRININPERLLVDAYVGHVAVYGEDWPQFGGPEMGAYQYETAGNRIKRLCAEEEIEFRSVGALDESEFMGIQDVDKPFPLMSSAAVSDDGFLIDPLDAFGIEYRTNRSLFNQPAALTVSYTAAELSGELQPVSDDAYIINDFTASRGGAGSARAQRSDGPLNVSPPPVGVGQYNGAQSYSLAHDGQCTDIASWHVHLGTTDEDRYPRVEVAIENLRVAADPVLIEDLLKLDVGERLDITDLPDFLPVEDIRQLVIGYEEWFDQFQHNFKMTCLPERPYEIARYDEDDRFGSGEVTAGFDVSKTDTNVTSMANIGPKWSTTAADFDVIINAERMTVTQVKNDLGATTSDTFTRADSTTNLGSTETDNVQAWTQTSGTWGINGNAAYISAALGGSIASLAAAADFQELSVTLPVWASGEAWLIFRADAGGTNRLRFGGTVGTDAAAQLIVASGITRTETADAAGNAFVLAAGDRLTVRAHGSIIECLINGTLALTFSETTFQTATRVGIQTSTTAPRFDDFVYESSTIQQNLTVTRSVNGVVAAHKAGDEIQLYRPPYRGI